MYKISIIVPVYNAGEKLKQTFKSIYNQTIGFNNLEIIFIDDNSTDDSKTIIEEYTRIHENVKGFYLKQNSGFAGKPRNIGIRNATSKYIMFLDSDDEFNEKACEILYDEITNNNVDIVSGNYVKLNENNKINNNWQHIGIPVDSKLEINNINEKIELLKLPASVWSKIFKKENIIRNKIEFPEGIPAQDLVFVVNYLLKAKGITYINKTLVTYKPGNTDKEDHKNKSVTTRRNKGLLSGYITAYLKVYDLLEQYNPKYTWLASINLHFWTKQLFLSNINLNDKLLLLEQAKFLFDEFNKSKNLTPQKEYEKFFTLMRYGRLTDAVKLTEIFYLNPETTENIRKKDVYLLFNGFDISIGGLAKSVFNRANLFAEYGYNVTLLNIDSMKNYGTIPYFKNFKYIENNFRNIQYLNDNVKFINIFDYLSDINTKNPDKKHKTLDEQLSNSKKIVNITPEYVIIKTITPDMTTYLHYYNKKNFTQEELKYLENLDKIEEIENKNKIKSEKYIDNILKIESYYNQKEEITQEKLYTPDGFNYLTINHEIKRIFKLKDRFTKITYEYTDYSELVDYFVVQHCLKSKEKPFLINDCSGPLPSIEKISSNIAYKITQLHSNHYKEPYCYGSDIRDIAGLNNIDDLDALVTLTQKQCDDIKKELNVKNIYTIPNFINKNEIPNINPKRDTKKIFNMFSRISYEKNISDAIKAFENVVKIEKDAQLHIYGRILLEREKEEYTELTKLIDELNLTDNVTFKGSVENIYGYMDNSLATIVVSKFEGFCMTILESMMNQIPVVSYDINYGPSDLINENDGYLIESGNIDELTQVLLHILKHPDEAKTYGINARNKVIPEYSEEMILNKWEHIFKEIIAKDNFKKYDKTGEILLLNDNITNQRQEINEKTSLIKHDEVTIEYYKLKGSLKKKALLFLPYIYILFKSGSEVLLNIKLYRILINNSWFNIGYYLNSHSDISRIKWCKILTPELHYVCIGHKQGKLPNPKHDKNLTKKEIIKKIRRR